YAKADAQPGDLTFTSGHPGSTHRLDTVAQLEYRRDWKLPRSIFSQPELRGHLVEFSTKGAEQARIARGKLFAVENSLKARRLLLFGSSVGRSADPAVAVAAAPARHCAWTSAVSPFQGGNAMKLPRRRFLHLTAVAAALPALPRIAPAQSYPS